MAKLDRNKIYKDSLLPSSFFYKMKIAFCGELCPICGIIMSNYYKSIHSPTVQHCIPLFMDGKHEIENIAIICKKCNISLNNKGTNLLNNKIVMGFWNRIKNIKRLKYNDIKPIFIQTKKECEMYE